MERIEEEQDIDVYIDGSCIVNTGICCLMFIFLYGTVTDISGAYILNAQDRT